MNIERAIRTVVDTGEVVIGAKKSIESARDKKAKLILVSENCPKGPREDLEQCSNISKIPLYTFQGSSMELGAVCGKPYIVSMLAVIEAGDSDIYEVMRRK